MISEQRTAQLRVKKNCIIAEGGGGTIFYATPTRARLLIDGGAAELVNVGPVERQIVGPSETKPTGPQEKKTVLIDSTAGPSTDSPASIESGKTEPSSVLVEAHRLLGRNAPSLPKRGRGRLRKSG